MPTYFRRKRLAGREYGKWCGSCGFGNRWDREACTRCNRPLLARPKKRVARPVDARLARANQAVDEWIAKLMLAATKVRYYRARVRTLERDARQRREDSPLARGIIVRKE